MKSIKWRLLATAALASLVFALTIQQQQNVAAFNDKNNQFVFNSQNHLQISEDHGIASNSVNTFNDGTSHYNDNFNSHREETFKSNSHTKPTKDD